MSEYEEKMFKEVQKQTKLLSSIKASATVILIIVSITLGVLLLK